MDRPDTTIVPTNHTVFLNTSLDTHIVLSITSHDTVSDLKEKIMTEHLNCFPMLGKIDVNGVKVARRKRFYQLSDSVVVKSVFGGVNGTWSLCVDAVSQSQVVSRETPLHLEPGSSSQPNISVERQVDLLLGELLSTLVDKYGTKRENLKVEKSLGDEHVKSAGLAVKLVESSVSGKGEKKNEPAITREEVNSTVAPPSEEEVDLKRKLSEASLDTEAMNVAKTREKMKRSAKNSDGETGLSSLGAGRDDNTRDVVLVASNHEKALDADHLSLETKKAGKILPSTGKTRKLKKKSIGAPSPCLDKGSDNDCGLVDNSVNMESLKTKPSNPKNREETPKEQKFVVSKELNTSTGENKKQKHPPLKKVKKSEIGKATPDNDSSKNVHEDAKAGRIATCLSNQHSHI